MSWQRRRIAGFQKALGNQAVLRMLDRSSLSPVTYSPRPQTAGTSPGCRRAVPAVQQVLRSPGNPLDPLTRDYMESRLGEDLSQVRVHTDAKAAESAESVGAKAYAVGKHIVFRGSHSMATEDGRMMLAHELIHTVQQRDASEGVNDRLPIADPDDVRELEAERGAVALVQGRSAEIVQHSNAVVARQEDPDENRTPSPAGNTPASTAIGGGGSDVVQLSASSSGGGAGGAPSPSIPDCSAWMGGRQVEHWFAGDVMGANHTYINFKENSSNYWLVEAGPLPTDSKHVGAWTKPGSWENRGIRIGAQYTTPESCATAKAALFSAQSTYHSAGLPYDPSNGPNSNSFTEHMVNKAPVLAIFTPFDWKWDYWRSHPRPF